MNDTAPNHFRCVLALGVVALLVVCSSGLCAVATAATNAPTIPPLPAVVKRTVKPASAAAFVPVQRRVDVKFAWDAANDSNVVAYRLKWGVASGNYTNVTTASGLTWTLSLQVGVTYYVAATSLDAAGNESKPSNEVTVTPQVIFKTYLTGSADLVTWADICPVATTNAAQMLRLEQRAVNLAGQ